MPVNISFSNTIQYVGYFIQKCNNKAQRLGVGVNAFLAPKLNPPPLLNQSWHDATSTANSTFLRKSQNTKFAISMLLVHVLCPGKSMTKLKHEQMDNKSISGSLPFLGQGCFKVAFWLMPILATVQRSRFCEDN